MDQNDDLIPCAALTCQIQKPSTLAYCVHLMSEETLKLIASTAIYSLYTAGNFSTPISSFDLLTRIITFKPPPGLLPSTDPLPRFRLTDRARLEGILQALAANWDKGSLVLSSSNGGLNVNSIHLSDHPVEQSRKRKRIVDEEADSAAGDEAEEEEDSWVDGGNSLADDSLSQQQKQIFALLQKGTAKGRLLAEEVRMAYPSHSTWLTGPFVVSIGSRTF